MTSRMPRPVRRGASLGCFALVLCLVAPLCRPAFAGSEPVAAADWYPEIAPFATGYLPVTDGHELYYELCGNPQGVPVMVLHGGPGGGSYPALRRYHDPAKYLIVLHDQRGAGRSRPHCELKGNTTQALVEDIEWLRRHLKLGRVQVFGGSWGSTLGLAYAETYPENVASLVLRGVFLGTRAELDHFFHGGAAKNFPDAFAQLQAVLPAPEHHDYPRQLLALLQSGDPAVRLRAARAWAAYETKLAYLEKSDAEIAAGMEKWDPYDFALIENYYMVKDCFLAEGQLLQNAGRLAAIPTVIVQGRYDVICPPEAAWKLHHALPRSRLVLVEQAGHSSSDLRMRTALVAAVKSLEAP